MATVDDLIQNIVNGEIANALLNIPTIDINDINIVSKDMLESPMHYAALRGFDTILASLIAAGGNVNLIDNYGKTPIMYALTDATANILITNGASLNIVDLAGKGVIHHATSNNLGNIVQYLIDNGINVNLPDTAGFTPLHNANNDIVANVLISNGANVDSMSNPLMQTPIVNLFNNNSLVAFNNALVVSVKGINAKFNNNETILHNLVSNDQVSNMLDVNDIDINALNSQDQTPLMKWMSIPDLTAATLQKALLKSADFNILDNEKKSAISYLAQYNPAASKALLDELIKNGNDINHQDMNGDTPLLLALKYSYPHNAQVFIDNSADTSIVNNDGYAFKDLLTKQFYFNIDYTKEDENYESIKIDNFNLLLADKSVLMTLSDELNSDPIDKLVYDESLISDTFSNFDVSLI